jgi:hypothetical protein
MAPKRWQDLVNGVLGLWMFASPSILGFAAPGSTATRIAWILGLAIVVFAGIAVYISRLYESGSRPAHRNSLQPVARQ